MYWTCPVLLGDPLNQNDPNFMWLEVGGFSCAPRNLGYPWSQDIHENRISHGYRDCNIFLYMFPIWWLNSPTLLVCSRRQDPHAIAIRRQQRLRHAMVWFGWKMYRDTWMMYCVCNYIVLVCLGCCVDLFVCVLICWLCTYVWYIDWFSDARFRHTSTFEIVFTRVGYVCSLQEMLRYDKIIVPTPLPLSVSIAIFLPKRQQSNGLWFLMLVKQLQNSVDLTLASDSRSTSESLQMLLCWMKIKVSANKDCLKESLTKTPTFLLVRCSAPDQFWNLPIHPSFFHLEHSHFRNAQPESTFKYVVLEMPVLEGCCYIVVDDVFVGFSV